MFHLDCGRKYFSAADIIAIIDLLAENNYTHLELAIGNEGLRFLFEDMSITANDKTYDGAKIKNAIISYNNNTGSSGYLSEADMESIFTEANKKGISIIPLLNSPGHMNAIIAAMEAVDMTNVRYKVNGWGQDLVSNRTIDLTNTVAVNFTQALIEKYAAYFQNKGCKYFNIGTDEYANDLTIGNTSYGGFASLSDDGYSKFVTYVNNIAQIVKKHNMNVIAFNDGFYYGGRSGAFDTDIIISYWTAGWGGYDTAKYYTLTSNGHKILNTNDAWYYVLGDANTSYTLTHAKEGVGGTAYNVLAGTTTGSNVVGCMICLWCDSPTAEYSTAEVKNVADLIKTFSTNNKDVFVKSVDTGDGDNTGDNTGDNSDVIEIRVPVGETKTEVVSETKDVRDSFKGDKLDESTALVSPDYINTPGGTTRKLGSVVAVAKNSSSTGLISDGTNYMVIDSDGNISSTTDINDATEFTVTRSWNYSSYVYTIQGNGNYLTYSNYSGLSTSTSSYDSFSFSYNSTGFCYSSGYGYYRTTYYLTYSASGWKMDESLTTYGKLYSFTTENKDDVSKTVLTITGVAVGTTYCEINGKTYKIIVEDKAPDGAMTSNSLTLEYWITNYEVYDGQNTSTNHTQTITTSTAGATSDEGIEIATIAPSPAYSFFDGTKTVYYWQAMRLDADNKQTNASSDDETADGTTLTHVRYHGGAWQYKTADGAWHYFKSDDQLVAYYLQKTEVTKEITTFTKDWGYGTGSTTPDTSSRKGQVALSVAVVYPDGQLSPTESEIYSKSTTIFNFWTNRDIGIVAPVNNSDYNISKITVTDGARASNTTANQWYANDTITWEKETTASGGRWYKETEVWNKSSGTTPMVNGAAPGIKWSAKNTAKLILIYLEPVEKDTNLEIVYYDDTAKREIKNYQVSMTYNQGETVPTFVTALKKDDTVIGGTQNWPGKTASEPDYLPDDAYVLNSAHVPETFNKNLTQLTGIADNYKSGIYEYNGANISDDGKTLTLHYQVKAFQNSKTIVVDFGLPVELTGLLDWFGVTDNGTVKDISLATGTALYDSVGSYGRAIINQNTWDSLTYTLQKLIDAEITIPLYLNFNSGTGQQQRQLKVIPATSVYYEDSFVGKGFKNGTGAANDAMWKLAGTEETAKQALSELGSKNIYGNDKAYENSSKFSMGSAKTVTVNSGMLNGWNDTSAWPTATFTFKGTGFDIISLTNNQSGAIIVTVSKNGNAVKNLLVDNYYGYTKNENGEWVVNNKVENCLYQIPVIQVRDLDYGEYTAEVKVFYNDAFNQTAGSSYSFWFDGFRVYDPMGKDNSIYTQDEEGYPQYIKLRDVVIKNGGERVFFIDGAGEANVTEYKNYGPNNEVYLANGQAISFRLADNANIATIQIGAKSPNAKETTVAKMQLGSSTTDIATATEMYYDITSAAKGQLVTITNNGNAILSLTNIKITYSNQSTTELAALSEGDEQAAVAAVRALYAAPEVEPVEPFKPERFETSWSSNVRKGSRAVLTVKASTDVDAIVVNGVTVTQFKTRTERIGYGWNAKRVTYREFSYMMTASEVGTINIPVVAVSNDLGSSAAYDSTLTVKPSSPIRDWIGGIFGRWF